MPPKKETDLSTDSNNNYNITNYFYKSYIYVQNKVNDPLFIYIYIYIYEYDLYSKIGQRK